MSTYLRPAIDAPAIRDADGQVIEFGNRWAGPPPEETYSVDTHPERFAPLHTVADALVAHLRDTYDVRITEGDETAADLIHPVDEVVRAIRVQPTDPACAALTFVLTAYPGVVLHAGLLHDFAYPPCGCDACDLAWTTVTDDLERQVLAVVAGRYRESIGRGLRPWVAHASTYPDGASSGGAPAQSIPARRLRAARPVLRGLPTGWAAWPRAAADS